MAQVQASRWKVEVDGVSGDFPCPSGRTLLEAMIAAGRSNIKVGCRSGGCGVCRVRIQRGTYQSQKMSRSRISEQDEADGIVLACRILPESDMALVPLPLCREVDDIGRAECPDGESRG